MLLAISDNKEDILNRKDKFQYEYYRSIEKYYNLNKSQKGLIIEFLGNPSEYKWRDKLYDISFESYKQLEGILKKDFTIIISGEINNSKYYPLFDHDLLGSWGLNTKDHMELGFFVDNLTSKSFEEAFEKGIFFLLLNNSIPEFIGDPEIIVDYSIRAEFMDRYQQSRKKMLENTNISINPNLKSKHDCLKFWILINDYRFDNKLFKDFLINKDIILGEHLTHFNELVSYFKNQEKKIIQIVNVC